jgi:hypothetical protein
MKTVLISFLMAFLFGGGAFCQTLDELLPLIGKTEKDLVDDGVFEKVSTMNWYNGQGVVLKTWKFKEVHRVVWITLYPDSSASEKLYTMHTWDGIAYESELPHGLKTFINQKTAKKILKKQKDIEILWDDKHQRSLGYRWDIENPLKKAEPSLFVIPESSPLAKKGLVVTLNFSHWGEGYLTHIKVDAN